MAKGRIGGPFKSRSMSNLRVSTLRVVTKKVDGKFMVIHYLSYLTQNSFNDFIDNALFSVNYTKFDEVISIVQRLGRGSYMYLVKSDIRSAFKLLPILQGDFVLNGFKFNGWFYFDKCLHFGCIISYSTFKKFPSFSAWLAMQDKTEYLRYCQFSGHWQCLHSSIN